MANQVAARLGGDDYQHLYGWFEALELLMPGMAVRLVKIEDEDARSVDDVTVMHEPGTTTADRFHQVKFHVDQRNCYSTVELMRKDTAASASLLQKLWKSWLELRGQDPERLFEIHLVSNWSWDPTDDVRRFISGHDSSLTDEFFSASPASDIGAARQLWMDHLGTDAEQFEPFCRSLRLRHSFLSTGLLEKWTAERMLSLGLKSDATALLIAVGLVRKWIVSKARSIDAEALRRVIDENGLSLPDATERCLTVHLVTIKDQKFDVESDFKLDWRQYFSGRDAQKGHEAVEPGHWNGVMRTELEELQERLNGETDCRLIHARGLARLSAWFAFGYVFSGVNRYTIEVDQNGNKWRTDANASPEFRMVIANGAGTIEGESTGSSDTHTVAVGISLTGSLEDAVRSDVASLQGIGDKVGALLLLEPGQGPSPSVFQCAGDVVAFAEQAKEAIRRFVQARQATTLLLYYFGPLSGACFLGHRLNAVCRNVQIMENQQPGYARSFLLD